MDALRLFTVIGLLAGGVASGQNGSGSLDFDAADRKVVRFAPSAFPQLPSAIRRELDRRGCTIPQVWPNKGTGNVIRGHFFQQSERNWAVLCSVNRVSTILIFRYAPRLRVVELAPKKDIDRLQSEGGDQIGYSREILIADRALMSKEPARVPIAHQGISDPIESALR